ncbi:TIGR02611 family protein [Phytohabitans flavus]
MTGTDVVDATGSGRPSGDDTTEDATANGEAGVDTSVLNKPSWRERMSTTLEVIRANPTGRVVLKAAVALAGLLVVAIGALLIPLPGPGWLVVLGGIGIWAIEFSWARRLLAFTRRYLLMWTRWVMRRSWTFRIALGLAGMVFVSAVVWTSVYLSFDINLVTEVLDRL